MTRIVRPEPLDGPLRAAAPNSLLRAGLLAACAALLALSASCAGDRGPDQNPRAHALAQFKQADTNGDDQLTREEMAKGLPQLAPHFDEIDQDHNGVVNFAELWSYLQFRSFAAEDARQQRRYR
ncbi:MAG: hypothetical protein ACRETW_00315 [Stenotrophobium sp.]